MRELVARLTNHRCALIASVLMASVLMALALVGKSRLSGNLLACHDVAVMSRVHNQSHSNLFQAFNRLFESKC